ncbi:MAG TPA: uroporphyrinogen decarboxylase family protein, partial [Candidatus Glassbacteria bacterium]|nr:uroporphyrinogen decarboxylase family protein [Candidatus Glassbacteria bacterium]
MTSRQRLLAAIERRVPDRLPVTTHHVMPSYLKRYLGGASRQEFFDRYGLDAIVWTVPHRPALGSGNFIDPDQGEPGFLESRRIASDDWRVEEVPLPGGDYRTTRYNFVTHAGTLSMVLANDGHSSWVAEHLIKNKSDVDMIAGYATAPACDVEAVNRTASEFGEQGIVRGHICCFDVFGQPGTWQDACCLVGTERLILETYDDPAWVHELLAVLQKRKLAFAASLAGARYDLLELGGGSASSTVISPDLFEKFVAPYDSPIIETAQRAGQRIVYHLCGGIMPLLERVAAMKPDAMETFTPPSMGADTDLRSAKERIGDRLCMIGGFDQGHYFTGCSEEETRAEVKRCFEE